MAALVKKLIWATGKLVGLTIPIVTGASVVMAVPVVGVAKSSRGASRARIKGLGAEISCARLSSLWHLMRSAPDFVVGSNANLMAAVKGRYVVLTKSGSLETWNLSVPWY